MFENFLFSLNTVMPLYLLIFAGYALKRLGFLTEGFISVGNRFVFYILLPTTLFLSVYSSDLGEIADWQFASFAIGATVVSFAAAWVVSAIFIKEKKVLGVVVQGSFRSNTVFVGIPLMYNLAGTAGVARFAFIVTLVMPLYNVCSILVLSACSGSDERIKFKTVAFTIVKNPFIIAIMLGILITLLNINLPMALSRSLTDISGMATPMALICIGSGISFLGFDKKFKYAVIAAIIKVVAMPAVFTLAAYAVGFRGIDLAAFMVLGGVPSAVAGYVMAVQMGGDGYIARNIILVSTLLSSVTLTIFIYILRVMGV
ncbi:MAG: AEC family transporter [Defluviitaleaceae bacterium]|nr:AEC family transporter [Defluviitaleaceae bacterium]